MLSSSCKRPASTRRSLPLAQSALGYFAQQKVAEHADPLRRAQLLRIDEIGFVGRAGELRQDPHQAAVLGCDEVRQGSEAEPAVDRPQLAVGVVNGKDRPAVAAR